jgi:cytochrome c-type biogenesis protein CcsB
MPFSRLYIFADLTTLAYMKRIQNMLFSMTLSGILLALFAIAIGAATFIENDYGTESAKALVYTAKWFEFLLLLLCINLLGSIFKNKMYRKGKLAILTFHVSFLLILLGAGITRFISYEGVMQIREGESSSTMLSDVNYFMTHVPANGPEAEYASKVRLAIIGGKMKSQKVSSNGKDISVRMVDYIPNAQPVLKEDPNGKAAITLVYGGMGAENERVIFEGENTKLGAYKFGFAEDAELKVEIQNGSAFIRSKIPYAIFNMMTNTIDSIAVDSLVEMQMMKVYQAGEDAFVIRSFMPKAVRQMVRGENNDQAGSGPDVIQVELKTANETQVVSVIGRKGNPVMYQTFLIDGETIEMGFGSRYMELPFSLKLLDFQLDRYPGSNSPSSYASEIVLIDKERNLERQHRIFMNNVLNYRGYRFFQSSYTSDEMGTILSVNHDFWGTWITYLGYLLLTLGLFLNFFNPKSRLRVLSSQAWKTALSLLAVAMFSLGTGNNTLSAQDSVPSSAEAPMDSIHQQFHEQEQAQQSQSQMMGEMEKPGVVNAEHASRFGKMLVQDNGGRIKPINTLASEVLRKVSRKITYNGMNAEQVFLGMLAQPDRWQYEPIIKVRNTGVNDLIGRGGKYVSFFDFFELTGQGYRYKLQDAINEVNQLKPGARGEYEKELLRVDERVNIVNAIFSAELLNIFPVPNHPNNKWHNSRFGLEDFEGDAREFVKNMLFLYASSVQAALVDSMSWNDADSNLTYLLTFQERYGAEVMPGPSKVKAEILYNKINIFNKLYKFFGLLGLIMIVIILARILKGQEGSNLILKILSALLVIGFLIHTFALGMRWYISGHAPWSNGYESMIYIAWATMLAGVIFMRRSPVTVSVTAILAGVILMTAGHSWMDPEITNLVPVLKSYWLIIHVAVITASYGFLAIGALIGFVNLLLYNFKNAENHIRLDGSILNLSRITEINLIIGVALLSVGTFLGGVWANESWGRYWGWDAKETWALVTMLVYSFMLHMRLIPGLKGRFLFNLMSLLSFSTVLMTYFGVNFYLSGLHSYAQGDPVPVPTFVYYTVLVIAVVSIMAYLNEYKINKGARKAEVANQEESTEE